MRLHASGTAANVKEPTLGKLTLVPRPVSEGRSDYIAYGPASSLALFENDWAGYAGVLCSEAPAVGPTVPLPAIYAPPNLDYLGPDDVVGLYPSGLVSVLYRRLS